MGMADAGASFKRGMCAFNLLFDRDGNSRIHGFAWQGAGDGNTNDAGFFRCWGCHVGLPSSGLMIDPLWRCIRERLTLLLTSLQMICPFSPDSSQYLELRNNLSAGRV
jgi:hypothetical protein